MTARVLVVAGTGSGVGKTSVTVGVARALTRRGTRVRAAKVGPDFLDPMQLTVATGRPCLNLDTYMMGEAYVLALVTEAARDVDVILIEGVMGLFDGCSPENSAGSTAEIARLLDAPIVLIADARGTSRSFAATVYGFTHFEPGLTFAGVIANHVGSENHGALLASALESASLPPLLAAIPAGTLPHLKSRHLGLIAPQSVAEVDALSDAVQSSVSLERLIEQATVLRSRAKEELGFDGACQRVTLKLAVAQDEAFGFIYADFRERVSALGVDWLAFSPLTDHAVPEGADALFLPGGYPEAHADALASNRPMLESLYQFAKHRPVYAECGGLMVLGESLLDAPGVRHKMSGVLPFSTCMGKRTARLGYCEVTLTRDTLWGQRHACCRGHEFHYSSMEQEPSAPLQRCYDVAYRKGPHRSEGFSKGRVLASYVHLHLASRPDTLCHFLTELAR